MLLRRLTRLSSKSTETQPVAQSVGQIALGTPGHLSLPARPMNQKPYSQGILQKYFNKYWKKPRYWTPAISLVQPSLELMESLELTGSFQKHDIRDPSTKKRDLKRIVEMLIADSFTSEERDRLTFTNDLYLSEINPRINPESFPGRIQVDFMIKNENTQNTTFVYVSNRLSNPDSTGSYYPIDDAELPSLFEGLSELGVDLSKTAIILTNGHEWVLAQINSQGKLNQTPLIGAEALLPNDPKRAAVIEGLIRYKTIRYENEDILDQTIDFWDFVKSQIR